MKAPKKAIAAVKIPKVRAVKVPVTEANLLKAATRLLSQRLVSTELSYVQRVLGSSASQDDIDTQVLAVRKLPWSSIVVPD